MTAIYDAALKVPRCFVVGSSCTSGDDLLHGKQSEQFGSNKEPNASPNTVMESCTDGQSGTYQVDEHIDKITVAAVGGQLQEGGLVEIQAVVHAWSNGQTDTADFYIAADASNPAWVLIGSKVPLGGGIQTLTMQHTLPAGGVQAVRVNFRYAGRVSSCSRGSWDDVDDLAFAVAARVAAGDQAKSMAPIPVAPVKALKSSICGTIGSEDRCDALSLCFWRGKKCRPMK